MEMFSLDSLEIKVAKSYYIGGSKLAVCYSVQGKTRYAYCQMTEEMTALEVYSNIKDMIKKERDASKVKIDNLLDKESVRTIYNALMARDYFAREGVFSSVCIFEVLKNEQNEDNSLRKFLEKQKGLIQGIDFEAAYSISMECYEGGSVL